MPVRQITLDIDTLYAVTWQNFKTTAIDNIFQATPFWYYLSKKGKRRPQIGGKWIEQPLEYADSSTTVSWIGRTHDLATQVTNAKSVDPITTAQYYWRYVTATIYRFWKDDQQNRGKAAMMPLVKTKINNAEKTLAAGMESTLFTLTNAAVDNKIEGLPNIVRDDPNPSGSTYTVGDILQGQGNHTWWNNKAYDFTGKDVTIELVPQMRTMYNNCSGGGLNEFPEVLITTQAIFELYEDETLEYKQIVNQTKGDASFESIAFKGKDLVWSPSCGVGKIYFLNFNYLDFVYDPDIDFDMTEWKVGRSDLDRVAQIVCAGNLTCSNRSRLGVMFGIGS